ncbi:MAG: hypothetical protein IPN59_03860 [Holophaga sp.]|nr:hypothetical protein [Holophaga sp.]
MPAPATWILACLLTVVAPLDAAKPKPKPAGPSAAQLQAQVKKLTAERDELKERLGATESIQQDLAEASKSRDLARQETLACRKELEQLKASFGENQSGSDAILNDLQKAKADGAMAAAENEKLRKQVEALEAKLQSGVAEGALMVVGPDITPAKAMNMNRITPKARKVDRGVVVVNVLVSENGEVLATRLLQGLPGDDEWVKKANDACVDAAKRLVFDPARAADGKTKVRVWQGVGFLID